MAALEFAHLRAVSPLGALAALVAAVAAGYMAFFLSQDLGHHLGRISAFAPAFVAALTVASAAGALTRVLARRAALLGMAASGLGALGMVWIWINLFTLEAGLMLLAAAALATAAAAGAVLRSQRPFSVSVSAVIGACLGLLILGAGLGFSIAPNCGAAGSSFHIDSWHQPWSAAYACSDGRLSFEFWPSR